jgi:hypothetical protein
MLESDKSAPKLNAQNIRIQIYVHGTWFSLLQLNEQFVIRQSTLSALGIQFGPLSSGLG